MTEQQRAVKAAELELEAEQLELSELSKVEMLQLASRLEHLSTAKRASDCYADRVAGQVLNSMRAMLLAMEQERWSAVEPSALAAIEKAAAMVKHKASLAAKQDTFLVATSVETAQLSRRQEQKLALELRAKQELRARYDRLCQGLEVLGWYKLANYEHSKYQPFRKAGDPKLIFVGKDGSFKRGVDSASWLDYSSSGLYRQVMLATEEQLKAQAAQVAEFMWELLG